MTYLIPIADRTAMLLKARANNRITNPESEMSLAEWKTLPARNGRNYGELFALYAE